MHKLLAWWQLLRIGNVFTAVSNVIAGFLVVQGSWQPVGPLLLLIAASALLYAAGMVLNDAFDAELDAVERPERPIPSGRVSRGTAAVAGWTLLLLGTSCAWLASFLLDYPFPGIVGSGLALFIIGYNVGFKSTPLGPWIMGGCRALNVLMGAGTVGEPEGIAGDYYAILVGVYATGLTYYARSENKDHWTGSHGAGLFLVCIAVLSVLLVPHSPRDNGIIILAGYFALHAIIAIVWERLLKGHFNSVVFRSHVSRMISGFIMMDSFVIFMVVGWIPALAVLCLLIPTWIASRFAPMT